MSGGKFAAQFFMELFSPENRAKRKARRAYRKAARRGETVSQPNERDQNMLAGYKTYIGIGTALLGVVLGWLGIGECAPGAVDCTSAETLSGQIMAAIDQIVIVAGLLFASYGRAKAKPKA